MCANPHAILREAVGAAAPASPHVPVIGKAPAAAAGSSLLQEPTFYFYFFNLSWAGTVLELLQSLVLPPLCCVLFCFVFPPKIWLPTSCVSTEHRKRALHPFASPGAEPSCPFLNSPQKFAPVQINLPGLRFCVGFWEPEPASWLPVAALPLLQNQAPGA